jgi:hypothetical protein
VSGNSAERFIDAILADRSPGAFTATRDDLDVVRAALELKTARRDLMEPDRLFVEELRSHLAATAEAGGLLVSLPGSIEHIGGRGAPGEPRPSSCRTAAPGRHLAAAGKAAAAVLLAVSAVGIAQVAANSSRTAVADRAPAASALHSGELIAADGRRLGRAYAYGGHPSWVFVDVRDPGLSGIYACGLRLVDGRSVRAGTVDVHDGTGDWAHTVSVAVDLVRGATLTNAAGTTVATATFS